MRERSPARVAGGLVPAIARAARTARSAGGERWRAWGAGPPDPATAAGAPDPRYEIAISTAVVLWRYGCWFRAAVLAAATGIVLQADARDLPRALATMLLSWLALSLAFAHTSSDALETIADWPVLRPLARHLSSTTGRATVDASGLAEGLGVFLLEWQYAGPFPLHGLSLGQRMTGIALAELYVWNAVLQAVIDPSWYNTAEPPPRAMRVFRLVFAPVLTLLTAATLAGWSADTRLIPAAYRYGVAGAPFLYYPAWLAFDTVLNAARRNVITAELRWREEIASDVHSLVKNPLTMLQTHLSEPDPALDESRSLAWAARITVEQLRTELQTPPATTSATTSATTRFADLWDDFHRTLPARSRRRCSVAAPALDVGLTPADSQLLLRILADLLTNALVHGGRNISIDLEENHDEAGPSLRLLVRDSGPGPGSDPLRDRRSSLALLQRRLQRLGGGMVFDEEPAAVAAWWPTHTAGTVAWSRR